MLHPGDVIREMEFRSREMERALARRQARPHVPPRGSHQGSRLRNSYYRQLASLGRRACALGLGLGCALETRACRQWVGAAGEPIQDGSVVTGC
jgi:hypothetical protein